MRRISLIFIVLLGIVGPSEAQQLAEPKTWDLSGSAALFYAKPSESASLYQDDWYFNGRYAATVGHYWTDHLKTEVEYATSGEGQTFVQGYKSVPGVAFDHPYYGQSFHRLDQLSARMVWQFGDNAWVHPYVSGGIVGDRERQRVFIPEQYQYPSSRPTDRVLLVPEMKSGPTYEYRIGVTAGAGAKFYLSRNAFFNTGVIATYSKPAATVSFLAGFGIDF